jgi:hypothetical protein
MRYFKLLISCGHMGTSKEISVLRFFTADSIVDAFESGNRMPRAKRKRTRTAVLMVQPISEKEYINGKTEEGLNSYLQAQDV